MERRKHEKETRKKEEIKKKKEVLTHGCNEFSGERRVFQE
jgi:hypothetical protein